MSQNHTVEMLLGRILENSYANRHDFRQMRLDLREIRRDIWHLNRRVGMESKDGSDIHRAEKWVVRVLTWGIPGLTLWHTGSWEAALQTLSRLLK
jgi:hypothetical protein